MSLINLAGQNNLSNLQSLDEDTLIWIENNKPQFPIFKCDQKFIEFSLDCVQKFTPNQEWFSRSEGINSIHGLRHILRTVANTAYLIKEKNIIDECIIISSLIAASLHDLHRKDDRGDKGHAERTFKWFLSNQKTILKHYCLSNHDIDTNAISTSILFHELLYSQILNNPDYKKNKKIVDLLKSSDALDRYRLPKLKWWINDKYLLLIPSQKAKLFAYTLVVNSERNYLKTGKSKESVIIALK